MSIFNELLSKPTTKAIQSPSIAPIQSDNSAVIDSPIETATQAPIPAATGTLVNGRKQHLSIVGDNGRSGYAQDNGLTANMPISEIMERTGTNFDYEKRDIQYQNNEGDLVISPAHKMVVRSDTGAEFNPVGTDFNIVNPRNLFECGDELRNRIDGCDFETGGYTQGGATVHTSLKLPNEFNINGDQNGSFLFLATGGCGNLKTRISLMLERYICNNQFRHAISGDHAWTIEISHRTNINWDHLMKRVMELPELVEQYRQASQAMADTRISANQARRFFTQVYTTTQEQNDYNNNVGNSQRNINSRIDRMMDIYMNEVTQQTDAASCTAYGLFNAVTFYHDHAVNVRGATTEAETDQRRLHNGLISGEGVNKKQIAWEICQELAVA